MKALPRVLSLLFISVLTCFLLLTKIPYGMHADYIFFVPHLISNKIYFLKNGYFSLPYYTPAFCGGFPQYADIQDLTFSLVQLLVNGCSNIYVALNLAFGVCLVLTYAGMSAFLRKLGMKSWISSLGGLLVALNGFIVFRWIIGHLIFHTYWTIPWILLNILTLKEASTWKQALRPLFWLSALFSLNLYSSGIYPLGIAVVLATGLLLTFWIRERRPPTLALIFLGVALPLTALLSASKLVAVFSLLRQFPRIMTNDVLSWSQVIRIIPSALFDFRMGLASVPAWIGAGWHEFGSYVGIVPLGLLLIWVWKRSTWSKKKKEPLVFLFFWGAITLVLCAFAMNGAGPIWAVLKELPVFRSNHAPYRMIGSLPIVTVALGCGLLNLLSESPRAQKWVGVLGVIWLLDVTVYLGRQDLKSIYIVPLDYPAKYERWTVTKWQNRNIFGGVMAPNPVFGWDSESLKPAVDVTLPPDHIFPDGTYNVTDPVALVYAPEVGRAPWSRLSTSNVSPEQVNKFLAFENPGFFVSSRQKAANAASAAAWAILLPALIWLSKRKS